MNVYRAKKRFFCTVLGRYIPVGAHLCRWSQVTKLVINDAPLSDQDIYNTLTDGFEYTSPSKVVWLDVLVPPNRFDYFELIKTVPEDQCGNASSCTGSTGVFGGTGPQGPEGLQGEMGPQGFRGIPGMDGMDGLQGAEGLQGPQGNYGEAGLQGAQGSQGSQGEIGFQGIQGLQGVQGVTGAPGTVLNWSVINSDWNAVSNYGYIIDLTTSVGNVILTLPASPSVGDRVGVRVISYEDKQATVAANGQKIENSATDLIVDIVNAGFTIVFSGATYGWLMSDDIPGPTDPLPSVIDLGNKSGAATLPLAKDTHHIATITGAITSWVPSGMAEGNGCTLQLTNTGNIVATTGLTPEWTTPQALADIASNSVLVVIRVSGGVYRAACKALS